MGVEPDCRSLPQLCDPGFQCDDGICVPVTTCTEIVPCAPGDVCLRPAGTSTTVGNCVPVPDACDGDGDCAGLTQCSERVLASTATVGLGRCIPGALRFRGDAQGQLRFDAECSLASDCPAPLGCTLKPGDQARTCGFCVQDSECGTGACEAGACIEPLTCATSGDCHPGRVCRLGACEPESCSQPGSGGSDLLPGRIEGLRVCDGGVDLHTFEQPADAVARLILTGARDVPLEARVFTSTETLDLLPLRLPGLWAADVPAAGDERIVSVEVFASVGGGEYDLELEFLSVGCARDGLDLLGRPAEDPARLQALDQRIRLRVCPSARVDSVPVDRIAAPRELDADVSVTGVFDPGALPPEGALDARASLVLEIEDGTGAVTSTETAAGRIRAELERMPGAFGDETIQVRLAPTIRVRTATTEESPDVPVRIPVAFQVPGAGVEVNLELHRVREASQAACQAPVRGTESILQLLQTSCPPLAGSSNLATDGPRCGPDPFPAPICGRYYELDWADAGPHQVQVQVQRLSGDLVAPRAAFQATCSSESTEVCAGSGYFDRPLDLDARFDGPPARVFVGSEGDQTLAVSLQAVPILVPTNDRCRDSVPIDVSNSTEPVTISLSTLGATSTIETETEGCAPAGSGAGGERFYRVEGLAGRRVQITLDGPPGGMLWLARDCARMEATCESIDFLEVGRPRVSQVVEGLTDLFIAVDQQDPQTHGEYELRIVPDPECTTDTEFSDCFNDAGPDLLCDENACVFPSSADACPGATVDLIDSNQAIVDGSLGAATNTLSLGCGEAQDLPELAYRIRLPADAGRIRAFVQRASFDAAVAIRPVGCAISEDQICNLDVVPGVDARPIAGYDATGLQEVWVLVTSQSGQGPFTLVVEREDP